MVELKGKSLLVKAFLALLVAVPSIYLLLPEAVCDLETDEDGNPKIVKYIYLSDSKKTATVIYSNEEGDGFNIFDDRCQKGMVYGQWQTLKDLSSSQQECPQQEIPEHSPWVLSYITNCETGEREKWLCDSFGKEADCNRADEIETPLG